MPLFPKQKEFFNAFKTKKFWYPLYGGAASGGKTMLNLAICHRMAILFPNTRYAIVRKKLTLLKKTSIPSYQKILQIEDMANPDQRHSDLCKLNRTNFISEYVNGSQILFVAADISKDPELLDLSGLELTGAVLEEANQMPKFTFDILRTRCGRWNNSIYDIPPFVMLNCNPDKGWLKETFYDPFVDGTLKEPYYFLPALPSDNPHNSKEYLQVLDSLPDPQRKRLKDGDWDYSDDKYQLVHYLWLKEQFVEESFDDLVSKRENRFKVGLGVDVAGGGADKTIFALFVGNKLAKFEEFDTDDKYKIAEMIVQRIKTYEINQYQVGIDAIGEGSGVKSILTRLGYPGVYEFKGSFRIQKKPKDVYYYLNLRAQSHWEFREDIRDGNIEVPNHKQFIKEATNVKWFTKDEYYVIEPKVEVKKRLGCSPDYLDAAVIANFVRKRQSTSYSVPYEDIPNTLSHQVATMKL